MVKKSLKIFIALFLVIAPIKYASAENAEIKTAKFEGIVNSERSFYDGEYASSSDFAIKGEFYNSDTGLKIPLTEWRALPIKAINNNSSEITLRHYSINKDKSEYEDIIVNVPVTTKEFNKKLKLQIYSTLYTEIDDISKIFNSSDFVFKNSLGVQIKGELTYDKIELNEGWNYVKYTFTPYKVLETGYGYEEYEIKTGTIKINLSK